MPPASAWWVSPRVGIGRCVQWQETPSFKANYQYMTGIDNEDEFDRTMKTQMPLGSLVEGIRKPVFIGIGEFDELTPIDQALATYERIRAPKEMRVYEDEFHPLGGVAAEIFAFSADWILRALGGEFDQPGRDVRHFMTKEGRQVPSSADPVWWLGGLPASLIEVRGN
jgi:hypothetical protein